MEAVPTRSAVPTQEPGTTGGDARATIALQEMMRVRSWRKDIFQMFEFGRRGG